MFDDVLAYFDEFPKVTIEFYSQSETYNPTTGQTTVEWVSGGEVRAWGLQRGATRTFINDRSFDDVDMVFVLEQEPSVGKYIKYDDNWYSIHYPDNVGLAGSVYTVGAKRVTKPVEAS